jgi:parallel beta-helix repeat protein
MVSNSSAPTLSNNILSLKTNNQDQAIGIMYQNSASGEARGNQLSGLYLGISVKDDASPLLDSNTIDSCKTGISYLDNAKGTANKNIILFGDVGILVKSPATPVITNNSIQAYFNALYSDPEDWINQLNSSGNDLTNGPPEIVIMTITPTP